MTTLSIGLVGLLLIIFVPLIVLLPVFFMPFVMGWKEAIHDEETSLEEVWDKRHMNPASTKAKLVEEGNPAFLELDK